MIEIKIRSENRRNVSRSRLKKTVNSVYANQGIDPGTTVSILITGDQEIQSLNNQFREIDSPTDVLSFESGVIDPVDGSLLLGDIVLSYDRAKLQASKAGHSIESELDLLLVHGLLHLLGYDHETRKKKDAMWSLQRMILGDQNEPPPGKDMM